jgi:adenine C2-methylase RlmN of 23S rRNA A2503 and tRNA A37
MWKCTSPARNARILYARRGGNAPKMKDIFMKLTCFLSIAIRCQTTRAISAISPRENSSTILFLQSKAANEFHAILIETLDECATLYATVIICVFQFSTCVAPRHIQLKTVTTPAIIGQILELIWKTTGRMSAKSIAEQLGI